MERKIKTPAQARLVKELMEAHGLDESQISFDNDSIEPIFDYEALNVLRLRLTDIQTTEPEIVERNVALGIVTVKCTATLPDGRSASDLGSAQLDEPMPDGSTLENFMQAQNVALSRAMRRAIRAVGINLLKVHRQFMETGEIACADIDAEFESNIGREIHKLANSWGHIKGKDKSEYQGFIENIFGSGLRSSLDLNDIQRSQLANMYRSMVMSREKAIEQTRIAA